MSNIFQRRTDRDIEGQSRRSPGMRLRWHMHRADISMGDLARFLKTSAVEVSSIIQGESVHEGTPWENPPDDHGAGKKGDTPCVCGHALSDHGAAPVRPCAYIHKATLLGKEIDSHICTCKVFVPQIEPRYGLPSGDDEDPSANAEPDYSTLTFGELLELDNYMVCHCTPGVGQINEETGICLCTGCGKLMRAATLGEFLRLKKIPFEMEKSS